jgi:hypothetical protein
VIEEAQSHWTMPELTKRSLLTPARITLATMWLLITVSLIAMLFSGVRNTGQFRTERFTLQIAYAGFLLWYLGRTGPSVRRLPDLSPVLLPKQRIGKLVPVVVLALLLVAAFSGGIGLVNLLLIIASIWVLLAWRSDIRLPTILLGLVLTLIAFLGGFPLWENQFIGQSLFWGLLIFVTPMFVAGGLLVKRTGIGGSQ